ELDGSTIDLERELLPDLVHELVQVNATNEDRALAPSKFENLALHGAEHVELFQDLLSVFLPLFLVGRGRAGEKLNVSADDRHRSLEIVNDLREQPADGREPLASLARAARSK